MNKKTRMLSMMMAAMLLAGTALTGCGEKDTGTEGSKEPASSSASSSAEEASLYTEPGTYPIANETIPLRLFAAQLPNTIDYNTNELTLALEEKMNLDLIFEAVPQDARTEKVNLAFASNDLPDMFFHTSVDDARYGVEEGQLIDLTELIETKCPRMQEIFEINPEVRGAITQTDGKIYQFPTYNECYHCTFAAKMWANTEHLKEMGVEVPTTTEEFYEVCKKFKELHPDGVPIGGSDGWFEDPTVFLINAFTYLSGDPYGLRVHNGTMESTYQDPAYREALKYMNKLYSEGLLYEAAFTTTSDQMKSILVEEGEPVLFFGQGASVNLIDNNSTPELYSHYYPIAPLEGPEGVRYAANIPSYAFGNYSITTACEHPEAAARFVDYLLTDEGGYDMSCGAGNWKYITEEDGWLGANGEPATMYSDRVYSQEPQNECWPDIVGYADAHFRFSGKSVRAGEELDIFQPNALETLLFKATKEEMEPYFSEEFRTIPPINFLLDENTSIQTIKVELQKYINENKVAFITGVKNINSDTDWKNYLDGLTSIGMPKLLEVYQTGYDRQYK